MSIHIPHAGLGALLDFEATKHGIRIEYEEFAEPVIFRQPFAPYVHVIVYCGPRTGTHELDTDGQTVPYEGPYRAYPSIEQQVQLGELAVAGVVQNRLVIFFDLASLFRQVDEQSAQGSETNNAAHAVFDAILAEAMPLLLANIKEYGWQHEAEEYARMRVGLVDNCLRRWREELSENLRQVDEKTWEIAGLVTKSERLRDFLAAYEEHTRPSLRRRAQEEHGELVKLMGSGVIRSLRAITNGVELVTDTVEVMHRGRGFELGPFRVELQLNDHGVHIYGVPGAELADGYWHPHVSTGAIPCLGTMGSIIAKTMGSGDVVGAVTTLLEFLRSYNHGEGYVSLSSWDPDYEESTSRYDSCYEDSGRRECATCDDSDCPYRDGAEQRCVEDHDRDECIECRRCSYHQQARQNCREDHAPRECVECDLDCIHAGEVEDCFNAHNGGSCEGCDVESCSHRVVQPLGDDANNEGGDP